MLGAHQKEGGQDKGVFPGHRNFFSGNKTQSTIFYYQQTGARQLFRTSRLKIIQGPRGTIGMWIDQCSGTSTEWFWNKRFNHLSNNVPFVLEISRDIGAIPNPGIEQKGKLRTFKRTRFDRPVETAANLFGMVWTNNQPPEGIDSIRPSWIHWLWKTELPSYSRWRKRLASALKFPFCS